MMHMRFHGPRGPRRPHRGGGCLFFFIPVFFSRLAGMVIMGIMFGGLAVMFLVIAVLSSEYLLIGLAAVFFAVMLIMIIISIINRKHGKGQNGGQNGENVTRSGGTTFVDGTNYNSYENRADAYARSREIDPFGHTASGAGRPSAPTTCPGCGSPTTVGDKFCTVCGRNLKI